MEEIRTAEEFNDKTLEGNVLIQFSATWCAPCKTLTKTMEALEPSHRHVKIYKVDVDVMDKDLLREYNVRSVPKLVMFAGGHDVAEMTGAKPLAVVEEFINENIN